MGVRLLIQVLIIPYYRNEDKTIDFCILKRADINVWQWVSGGVESAETQSIAAYRELGEELGIKSNSKLIKLESNFSIAACNFTEFRTEWTDSRLIVQEQAYGFEVDDKN